MTAAYLVILWRACGGAVERKDGIPERVGGTVKMRDGVRVFVGVEPPEHRTPIAEDAGSLPVLLASASQRLPHPPPKRLFLDRDAAYQWCLDYGFNADEAQALTGGSP